jgi:mannose-6-phosphate isomerase-like protein (cupin superfamily)
VGVVHRLENTTDELLEIIEVQSGDYLGEDDITRLEEGAPAKIKGTNQQK